MANYNKQFNFRNGVQVDDDNLVVNAVGLVGIGTTVPTENLDVRGNVKATGFSSATSSFTNLLTVFDSAGIGTINLGTQLVGAGVSIRNGIITAADSNTGIVTFYGDARFLSGMPTSQWVDIDAGLGFTSIYNRGFVGVATDDPRFTLQIGGVTETTLAGFGTGVGISSVGNVLISGITTSGTFVGIGSELQDLDANRIAYGTISTERLPIIPNDKLPSDLTFTGVITATRFDGDVVGGLTGDVTGTASTALSLSGTPNIIVGILTANAVAASSFIGGITGDVTGNLTGTATTAASLTSTADVDIADLTVGVATVSSFIGVGTDYKTGGIAIGGTTTTNGNDLFINRAGADATNAKVQLLSNLGETTVTIGSSENALGVNAQLRYGNRNPGFDYSTPNSFDIINYGDGNINTYLQAGSVGINTGSIYWHDRSDVMMVLTYEGNLGIGLSDPVHRLSVLGISTFTGNAHFNGDVTIDGNISVPSITADVTGNVTGDLTGNVNGSAGISTFNTASVTQTITAGQIGISTDPTGLNRRFAVNTGNTSFIVDSSGRLGVRTDLSGTPVEGINAPQASVVCASIGLATDRFNAANSCAVDFGQVGSGFTAFTPITNREFMRVPRVTAAQIAAFTGLLGGEIVYDIDNNVHKGYNGTTWNNLY
mgnify:FL=1|tara:strand:- start:989 stop:2959 length:1971 start_codon:yes stop_codon:yes gene_type:complete